MSTKQAHGELTVQLIVYQNPTQPMIRAIDALTRSIELARLEGLVSRVVVRMGDCSPSAVFDGPTIDKVTTILSTVEAEFDYIFFNENMGHGGGQNRLFKSLDTDLVLVCNPDVIVSPDTLSALLRAKKPEIGIVDARQIPLEHPKDYDSETGETGWASGACMLTSAEVVDAVQGFDSDSFFLYCDDVDFSWRVRLAGYRIVTEPAARVFHDKRLAADGTIEVSPAEEYYSAEAAMILAHKYSRPRLASDIADSLTDSKVSAHRRAAAEFRRRKLADDLPTPIDPDHLVGTFIDGNYAVHKF
ncbi:hypothetical protein [Rhodococcus sp. NPDC003383]